MPGTNKTGDMCHALLLPAETSQLVVSGVCLSKAVSCTPWDQYAIWVMTKVELGQEVPKSHWTSKGT